MIDSVHARSHQKLQELKAILKTSNPSDNCMHPLLIFYLFIIFNPFKRVYLAKPFKLLFISIKCSQT